MNALLSQANNLFVFSKLFSASHIINKMFNIPITVNMLITSKCNLHCGICSARDMLDTDTDLTYEQIGEFINTIFKCSPAVFIGGGEPFLRKDIFDILECLKKNRLKYGIVTNGTVLNQKKIDRLFTVTPEVLIFSIYGPKVLHESMTGMPDSFDRISDNIKYAVKKNKTKIILNCVINESNYEHLEECILLGQEFGVAQVRFEHLIFVTEKEYEAHISVCKDKFSEEECKLTTNVQNIDNPEMGQVLKDEIFRLQKKFRKFVLFKPYLNKNELSGWYNDGFKFNRNCSFIRHSVFIKHNGDIIPCQFLSNYVLGNIKKNDLIETWRGRKKKQFDAVLKKGILPGCVRCCKL
ncbi:MAG: radical SAM protein [Candidatus Omnitrophota bacterium]